jgi:hypothetical protein
MPFRSKMQKASSVHDKSKSTLREKSKDHKFEERKEMEKEFTTLEKEIQLLLKDGYELDKDAIRHNVHEVNFINHRIKEVRTISIVYHENYSQLQKLWGVEELS